MMAKVTLEIKFIYWSYESHDERPSFVEIVQDFMKKKKIYYFGFGSVDMKVFDDYINLVIKEIKN